MSILAPTSERRSWVLFAVYLVAIYATAIFGRDVAIALRQKHLIGGFVSALYVGTGLVVVYYVVFDVRLSDKIAFLALAVLAMACGWLVLGLGVAEERIHFLQYGILALLARRGLSWAVPSAAKQYLGALVIAAVAGFFDELLQVALPDRTGAWADVELNAVSAFLALVADELMQNRLGWLPAPAELEDET